MAAPAGALRRRETGKRLSLLPFDGGEMSRSGAEIHASKTQSRFIQERVMHVEKNFGSLCETLASYTRKTARIRDKGDGVSSIIASYIEKETLNPSSKKNLSLFAENLSAIQDYRQAEVQRLDSKVIVPLSSYGIICKQKRNDLKLSFSTREKEEKQKKQLRKIQATNPSNRHQIAETDLQKASVDASRTSKLLEQEIDKFEMQKLTDLKKILADFVNIEMVFHAKALEMYTKCYQNLAKINVDEDLEEFRNYLHPPDSASRMEMAHTASLTSLNTHKTPDSRRNSAGFAPSNQSPMQYDDDDDDDDEYEDEEEEESEEETTQAKVVYRR